MEQTQLLVTMEHITKLVQQQGLAAFTPLAQEQLKAMVLQDTIDAQARELAALKAQAENGHDKGQVRETAPVAGA